MIQFFCNPTGRIDNVMKEKELFGNKKIESLDDIHFENVSFSYTKGLRRPRQWTLHTKLTLSTYSALSAVSALAIAAFEWTNPHTYGARIYMGLLTIWIICKT